MIPQKSITKFLARNRDDFRYYKEFSEDKLERLVLRLPVRPPIWRRLRMHQRACFLIGTSCRAFGFFLDTGCGKTLLSIALIRYFYKLGKLDCALVLVPNRTNKYEWAAELQKHSPSSRYLVLEGSSNDKWDALEENQDAQFVIETYAGLARMLTDKEWVPSKRGGGRTKLVIKVQKLKVLRDRIQAFVMDESTFVKNMGTLPYRICRQLAKTCKIRFALTGTPFGREPVDLWAQLHLIDKGESLGETLTLFRAAFYSQVKGLFGRGEYSYKQSMTGTLNKLLAHSTIRYTANKADLPRVTYIKKLVQLDEEAEAYYQKARERLMQAGGNPAEIKQMFVRMRQISSGFVGYYNTALDQKSKITFDPNAKLESLSATVQLIDPKDKFIAFHEFIPSGDMICKELERLRISFVRLGGSTKDPERVRHVYNTDPSVQGLVMNHAAGGYGLNLQVCKYGLVYESPLSVILRKQIEARFIRQYSQHANVFLIDFVAKDTVDARILEFHKEGRDLLKAVLAEEVKL